MPQLNKGDTFADGQQVTGIRLNNLIDGATLLVGAITDQPAITANTLEATDTTIVNDAGTLKEASIGDILNSNLSVTTSAVTAGANSDILITPNDGTIVTGQAYTSGDGLTVTVTSTAHILAVGQVILVTAAGTGYNGTFRVATIATNSFTYVMSTAATAGSGTLSYIKKGLVKNPANKSIAGNLYVDGSAAVSGNLNVAGSLNATGTGAIKLPVGTTAERPATPVAGQFRYNSTLDTAEVYSGTEWKAAGGLPFDATGGTITTVDGYQIHTFTTSGTFTPVLTRDGKIEFIVVGGGGGGASANSGTTTSFTGGGGGGGGAVKYGTLFVAKNTAPMSVIIGTGGAYGGGSGTSSSFSTLTSLGGSGGSFPIGSNNAPGGQGGLPSSLVGDGGGGHRWDQNGDAGSEGFGSFISGTLVNYGGGGGGGGYGGGKGNGGGGYGGGYSSGNAYPGTAPVVSSGGGGGGGSGPGGPAAGHAGAAGIVIIRYRVS